MVPKIDNPSILPDPDIMEIINGMGIATVCPGSMKKMKNVNLVKNPVLLVLL